LSGRVPAAIDDGSLSPASGKVEKPLVSVGVPVHNGGPHLRDALDALLAQDYENLEIVVADNASTDDTPATCREYEARDSRVRVHRYEKQVSFAQNFNRTLKLAEGEYFFWAAHDDTRETSFVSKLVDSLRAQPGAVLAFGRFDNLDHDGSVVSRDRMDWPRLLSGTRFARLARFCLVDEARSQKGNLIYGLIRRDVLLECGGMALASTDYSGEDIVTLLRLLTRGSFAFTDRVLFHYRIRALVGRGEQPLGSYLRDRIVGRREGHRGNLLLALQRNHVMHAGLRRVLAEEGKLSHAQVLLLRLALWLKELLAPPRLLTTGVIRELRSRSAAPHAG
jgi:glycosyltransferase involved in cell wall biosynthesis